MTPCDCAACVAAREAKRAADKLRAAARDAHSRCPRCGRPRAPERYHCARCLKRARRFMARARRLSLAASLLTAG